MAGERVNLLGLPRAELEAFVAARLGAKPFRARQLMKWIYRRGAADFSSMTDLSQDFRSQLSEVARIAVPEIVAEQVSSDGTRKWMLRMDEVQGIETVYIPEPDRGTLCISSQVGCAMDCSFCSTAQQGFNRNLSVAEIVGQVWLAHRELTAHAEGSDDARGAPPGRGGARGNITNIVFMGMGELVPINRKHPIGELLAACWHYIDKQNGRSVTFEYVMLDGVNDNPEHARQLARLLKGRPAKLNLIPFNAFPGTRYRRSSAAAILKFRDILNDHGVIATIRRTRGDDIDAACGQLAGRVTDRTLVRLGTRLTSTSRAPAEIR